MITNDLPQIPDHHAMPLDVSHRALEASPPRRQLVEAHTTVRESVVRVEAFADGRLEIEFGSGALATVDSSEEFEAWNLVGPGGATLVATPGGGVTAWGVEVA